MLVCRHAVKVHIQTVKTQGRSRHFSQYKGDDGSAAFWLYGDAVSDRGSATRQHKQVGLWQGKTGVSQVVQQLGFASALPFTYMQ